MTTWNGTGQDVSGAAQAIKRFIEANEGDFKPAVANFRQVAQKFNESLDPETQKALQSGINRFSSAAARIDAGLADLEPALKDLGANVKDIADHGHRPGRPPPQPDRRPTSSS